MQRDLLRLLADFGSLVRERVHVRIHDDGKCELHVVGVRPLKFHTYLQMYEYLRREVSGEPHGDYGK